jgi:hypothetical protein
MKIAIDSLPATERDPVGVLQALAAFGCSRAVKFAQLNMYAGLATLDNSTHHFLNLARSQDIGDAMELQIGSLLPAAESAKAYVGQVISFAASTNSEIEQVVESQASSIHEKAFDNLCAVLAEAEANGTFAAKILKDTLVLTRESALSTQASIRGAINDAMNLPDKK